MISTNLAGFIRDVPDFPKKNIIFKDITPLLRDAQSFREAIGLMARPYQGVDVDFVVGVESRGFIFGAALAMELNAGFIPVRKKGKLPARTKAVTYALEYGTDTLEIHLDAMGERQRVVVVDDVLATGGTICAVLELMKAVNADVLGVSFLMELVFLDGRAKILHDNDSVEVHSILKY
jgi:adenine phosphoribosyltransferase